MIRLRGIAPWNSGVLCAIPVLTPESAWASLYRNSWFSVAGVSIERLKAAWEVMA